MPGAFTLGDLIVTLLAAGTAVEQNVQSKAAIKNTQNSEAASLANATQAGDQAQANLRAGATPSSTGGPTSTQAPTMTAPTVQRQSTANRAIPQGQKTPVPGAVPPPTAAGLTPTVSAQSLLAQGQTNPGAALQSFTQLSPAAQQNMVASMKAAQSVPGGTISNGMPNSGTNLATG